tara:strand:+ start:7851 stop:8684 length:834 start_codon:yes stop_codon:yes gene_type:complete
MLKIVASLCFLVGGSNLLMAADNTINNVLEKAANGSHRSVQNINRNSFRHPVETLMFLGLEKGMTVIEISPGGLWYTEILAPALKDNGQLIAAGYDASVKGQPAYRYKQQKAMEARFVEQADIFGEVKIAKFSPPQSIQLGGAASADMVVTFRNTHGWVRDGIDSINYKAFYEVLAPGGILGVVQHRAVVTHDNFTGYLPEEQLINAAETAGFVLEARSEINANSKDTRDHPKGVWTLPPSLRLGDVDREKYLEIGESDRMTLRFRKPLKTVENSSL